VAVEEGLEFVMLAEEASNTACVVSVAAIGT